MWGRRRGGGRRGLVSLLRLFFLELSVADMMVESPVGKSKVLVSLDGGISSS